MTIQITVKNEEELNSGATVKVDADIEVVFLQPGEEATIFVHKDVPVHITEVDNPNREL